MHLILEGRHLRFTTHGTVHGFKLKNGANYSPHQSGSRFNGSRFTVIFEDRSRPSKIIRYTSQSTQRPTAFFSCTGSVHVLTVHSSQFTVHVLNEQILFSVRKSQNQTLYFLPGKVKEKYYFPIRDCFKQTLFAVSKMSETIIFGVRFFPDIFYEMFQTFFRNVPDICSEMFRTCVRNVPDVFPKCS